MDSRGLIVYNIVTEEKYKKLKLAKLFEPVGVNYQTPKTIELISRIQELFQSKLPASETGVVERLDDNDDSFKNDLSPRWAQPDLPGPNRHGDSVVRIGNYQFFPSDHFPLVFTGESLFL